MRTAARLTVAITLALALPGSASAASLLAFSVTAPGVIDAGDPIELLFYLQLEPMEAVRGFEAFVSVSNTTGPAIYTQVPDLAIYSSAPWTLTSEVRASPSLGDHQLLHVSAGRSGPGRAGPELLREPWPEHRQRRLHLRRRHRAHRGYARGDRRGARRRELRQHGEFLRDEPDQRRTPGHGCHRTGASARAAGGCRRTRDGASMEWPPRLTSSRGSR